MDLDEKTNRADLRGFYAESFENLLRECRAFVGISPALDFANIVEKRCKEENILVRNLRIDSCKGLILLGFRCDQHFDVVNNLKTVLVDRVVMVKIVPFEACQRIVLGNDCAEKPGFVHGAQYE